MSRIKEGINYFIDNPTRVIAGAIITGASPLVGGETFKWLVENPNLTTTQVEIGAVGSLAAGLLGVAGGIIIASRGSRRNS